MKIQPNTSSHKYSTFPCEQDGSVLYYLPSLKVSHCITTASKKLWEGASVPRRTWFE